MKTREERTTQSQHFDWVENLVVERWTAYRNGLAVMAVEYKPQYKSTDGLSYELSSRLPGQSGFAQGFATLEIAKDMADKRWADWVHMMGLVPGTEWWKERDQG